MTVSTKSSLRAQSATLDSIPIIRAISTNCHYSMSVDRPSGFDPLQKFGSQFSLTGADQLKKSHPFKMPLSIVATNARILTPLLEGGRFTRS